MDEQGNKSANSLFVLDNCVSVAAQCHHA